MGIRLELLFVCISNRHTQVLGCPRNGICIDAPLNMHKPGTNRLCFISTCFYSVFSNQPLTTYNLVEVWLNTLCSQRRGRRHGEKTCKIKPFVQHPLTFKFPKNHKSFPQPFWVALLYLLLAYYQWMLFIMHRMMCAIRLRFPATRLLQKT